MRSRQWAWDNSMVGPNDVSNSSRSSVLQLPPPYSPLFYTVMYVRPDSDRLPKYLVNSGVKFCGQGRKLPSADSDSMNAAPSASTDASSMQAEISSSQWKENGFAEIWFSGFLMGIAACIVVTTLGKKRVPSSTRFRPAIDA